MLSGFQGMRVGNTDRGLQGLEGLEKKTPLYEEHVNSHARLAPFAGFLMPIQYSGIMEEHRAVRNGMGMFDLSHMGEFRVTGRDAVSAIDRLVTNDIESLQPGQIRYTPMCYPEGGIVDDLLVYRFEDHLTLVVNASNIEKDFDWVSSHVPTGVQVEDVSEDLALIAVQGPRSEGFLQSHTDVDLTGIRYYEAVRGRVAGIDGVISRTGYTGEDGFELYIPSNDAVHVWETLLDSGAPAGLKPIGLGARDTLRLEAGLMLYGNDIDDTTTPLEAGLGWTVKFGPNDFVGRDALEWQKSEGLHRRMVAVEVEDRGIPRPHFEIRSDGEHSGELTSGTYSPTFERGIGLAYVRSRDAKIGTSVGVVIRQQEHPARIVRKPMYKREEA
jgi:aminomethyltransferase